MPKNPHENLWLDNELSTKFYNRHQQLSRHSTVAIIATVVVILPYIDTPLLIVPFINTVKSHEFELLNLARDRVSCAPSEPVSVLVRLTLQIRLRCNYRA